MREFSPQASGSSRPDRVLKNIQWLEKQLKLASAPVEPVDEVPEAPVPVDDPAGASLNELQKLMDSF